MYSINWKCIILCYRKSVPNLAYMEKYNLLFIIIIMTIFRVPNIKVEVCYFKINKIIFKGTKNSSDYIGTFFLLNWYKGILFELLL